MQQSPSTVDPAIMVRVVEVAVTQTWPPPARSRGNATRLGAEPGNATVASFRSCIAAARSHGETAIVAAIKNKPAEARIAALHARRTTRPPTTPRCSEARRARCHITRHGPASHLRKNRRRTSPAPRRKGRMTNRHTTSGQGCAMSDEHARYIHDIVFERATEPWLQAPDASAAPSRSPTPT